MHLSPALLVRTPLSLISDYQPHVKKPSLPTTDWFFFANRFDRKIQSLRSFDPNAPEKFKSHAEFDLYVNNLITERYPDLSHPDLGKKRLKAEHPDIYNLLKGIDRTFWVLLLGNPDNISNYIPVRKDRLWCVFFDPR